MFFTMILVVFAIAGLLLLLRSLVRPVMTALLVLLFISFLTLFFLPADPTPDQARRSAPSEDGDKVTVSLH